MRFSLFTMIAGASRSSRRLSRLLRLITRRYRSLRSDAAKRPPSSWTIGRRSGGMTGMTSRIMFAGLLPPFRKASTTSRRLTAFSRFCFWESSSAMMALSFSASEGRSMAASRSRTASAPIPPLKYME